VKGMRDSRLLQRWRAIYDATNPGRTKDQWLVDGVEWTRARHSCFSGELSFQLEIHTLIRRGVGRASWCLLVVIEHWWGPDRNSELRFGEWSRLVYGRADDALAWIKRQSAA
jgi:hypothetical protein